MRLKNDWWRFGVGLAGPNAAEISNTETRGRRLVISSVARATQLDIYSCSKLCHNWNLLF
jgi:hypothetical protein